MKPATFEKVWIDTAPMIASPCPTGRVIEVTVHHENGNTIYCCSEHGSYLYVNKSWIRPAPKEKACP